MFRGRQAVRRFIPARDQPEDVVGFEVPLCPQDLRYLGVIDPAPAQLLEGWRARNLYPFDGSGVRVSAHVKQKGRRQGAPHVAVFEIGARLRDTLERQPREVVDADRVIQARMTGPREGPERKSELAHAPQALHRARLEQRLYRPIYGDVPPDNVPDSSAGAPEELPYRTAQ